MLFVFSNNVFNERLYKRVVWFLLLWERGGELSGWCLYVTCFCIYHVILNMFCVYDVHQRRLRFCDIATECKYR